MLAVLLIAMIYCFMSEKLPMDLTAFLGLIVISLFGLVSPDEAFSGFSSPAVITMISIFFVSAALRETGIADWLALRVHRLVGGSEVLTLVAVMAISSFFSAFMNNVAAVALLLPSVMSISSRASVAPSRLLIPLSFGTLLGGMTTLIGTPPNIIVSDMLRMRGFQPFAFLDFTVIGVSCVVLGIVFMAIIGRFLLPENELPRREQGAGDLVKIYKLFEQIFSVRVAKGSFLHGQTLASTRLGDVLGAQVISIVREGKQSLAPRANDILKEGDVLVLGGRISDLEALRRFCGLAVDSEEGAVGTASADVRGATFQVIDSSLVGKSLREMDFHSRWSCVVMGIERGGAFYYRDLSSTVLQKGDLLHVLGRPEFLEKAAESGLLAAAHGAMSIGELIEKRLFVMRVPDDSILDGMSIKQSRLGELLGLRVVGIVRNNNTHLAITAEDNLTAGDKLLVLGEPRQLEALGVLSEFEILSEIEQSEIESTDVGLVEVTLSPRSKLVGSSLREVRFREKYDFQVLAVWREGNSFVAHLGEFMLRLGDALLLQGPRSKIPLLVDNPDFVVLSGLRRSGLNIAKAPYVVLALLIMIFAPIFNWQPVHLSAFMAASLVLLSGAVKMQDAYRAVEWRVVFFVATLIPMGYAFDHSGASSLLANAVVSIVDGKNPYPALILLTVLGSLVSQVLDSAPAAVLLSPVALQSAQQLGVSPYPFMMALALSASIAFMTPFSHKANLLVVGPGGYRPSDFFSVGTWLSLIVFIVIVALVPVLFPF